MAVMEDAVMFGNLSASGLVFLIPDIRCADSSIVYKYVSRNTSN